MSNNRDKQDLIDRFVDWWADTPKQKIAMQGDLEKLKAEWQEEALEMLQQRLHLNKYEVGLVLEQLIKPTKKGGDSE